VADARQSFTAGDAYRGTGTAACNHESPPQNRLSARQAGLRTRLRRLRIHISYMVRHRRLLNLRQPARFTEWVQWRKCFDHDPRHCALGDKVAVKDFVTQRIGARYVTPTLWHGTTLPGHCIWPFPFVIKSRHGCNQYMFIRSQDDIAAAGGWAKIRRRAEGWLTRPYGIWLDEWAYRGIDRGIIVEPFVADGQAAPIDYKLYIFGGRVHAIQVHLDREHAHRWMVFDRDWNRASSPTQDPDPVRPASMDHIIRAAEQLSEGFDFLRCDFYDIAGTPRFGEITLYPGSGLDRFDPPELDDWLGSLWTKARQEIYPSESSLRRSATI